MDAPRAIATPISDGQASLPDTDCLLPFIDCEVIRHPPYVSRNDRVDVHELSSACGLARLRRSSPDLCVKAEEAPRLRLGCLGDLLFLEE